MATRMGRTAEKMGGWSNRKERSSVVPAEVTCTRRRVSPLTSPSAWKRPTSESSEKEKDSITSAGLSFTLVRATAVPVWPRAGSSRAMTSSSSKPSGTVSRREVASPTARSPILRV